MYKYFVAIALASVLQFQNLCFGQIQPAAEFRTTVNNVVYSLDTMDDVLASLKIQDNAASGAISKDVSQELTVRVFKAIDLMMAITYDAELKQTEKVKYLDPLAAAIGQILFRLSRHHGQDKVSSEKTITDMESGKVFLVSTFMTILREFALDFKTVFYFLQDANGKRVWAPVERRNREQTARDVVMKLAEYPHASLNELDENSRLRRTEIKSWKDDILEPIIVLRRARLGAQKVAAYTYLGLAFLALQTGWPVPVDFVGAVTHYTEHTYEFSGYLQSIFFLVASSTKFMTISTKTVKVLDIAKKAFDNPKTPLIDLSETLNQKSNRLAGLLSIPAGLCRFSLRILGK